MMLIRKRIRVETWLEEQIEELFDGDDVSTECLLRLSAEVGGCAESGCGGLALRAGPSSASAYSSRSQGRTSFLWVFIRQDPQDARTSHTTATMTTCNDT